MIRPRLRRTVCSLPLGFLVLVTLVWSSAGFVFAQASRETVAGVTNFGRVTDTYFRGGKVTPGGVRNLAGMGVRTIVDLRDEPSPGEPEACAANGIAYIKVPFNGHATPDTAAVDRVLGIITKAETPVYVHCSAGKHRAGTICALYRLRVQGWSADDAWAEQRSYGFGPVEGHPELYAFVYGGRATADGVAVSKAAESMPVVVATSSASAKTALSGGAVYIPLRDVLAAARKIGGEGDVLKVDLEYDLERALVTWDVTFSSGVEYEFDAVTGESLGSKTKAPAKLATMLPVGIESGALKPFNDIIRGAEEAMRQPVQEMELKHTKGTRAPAFEVVYVDGSTVYFDAVTGYRAEL